MINRTRNNRTRRAPATSCKEARELIGFDSEHTRSQRQLISSQPLPRIPDMAPRADVTACVLNQDDRV